MTIAEIVLRNFGATPIEVSYAPGYLRLQYGGAFISKRWVSTAYGAEGYPEDIVQEACDELKAQIMQPQEQHSLPAGSVRLLPPSH